MSVFTTRLFAMTAAALLMLAGCATEVNQGYINSMDYFVGKPEALLIDRMGVPDKAYKIENGPKLVSYTRINERTVDGGRGGFGVSSCIGRHGQIGFGGCVDHSPKRIYTYYCEVTFTIEKRKVTTWRQQGNDCPRIR
jgi:hypothetical protein